MGAILFLYKKSFKNRAKKALRKPVTYLYFVLILIYGVMMPFAFKVMLDEFHWDNTEKLAAIITVIAFWLIPLNLVSYAKRKGLIFRKGDVHLLFASPVSPKKALLYAHIKTLFLYTIVGILIMACSVLLFHASAWQLLLFFLVNMILENLLEGSLMTLLYGSEKLGERGRRVAVLVAYAIIGVFFLLAALMYLERGLSVDSVLAYLHSSSIQMVPLVGWYIGFIHLIFMGPTTVNVIVSILYLLSVVVLSVMALKMRCSGEYYEDAMKFAEDFEELTRKKQEGQMAFLGKKEKFGKAKVTYKGGGAKAIFYKQLLEYKKSKLFFFDSSTIMMLLLGVFLGYVWSQSMMEYREFLLPLVMSYLVFCMSAVGGKWSKEILNPFTFLIPDSPMRKLWYATLMEHIRSLVCGIIFAIPAGILWKLPPIQVVLGVIFFVCLQACKIYNTVVAEVLVGNVLGKTGKQLFVMFLQGMVVGITAVAAILGIVLISMEAGYLIMIGVLAVICLAMMTVANSSFDKMETTD